MKFYLGKIEERNGELEYSDIYLFATEGDPHEYAKTQAKEWRRSDDDDWDEDQQGWWCDCTLIFDGGFEEVPEEDFHVLAKYTAVL